MTAKGSCFIILTGSHIFHYVPCSRTAIRLPDHKDVVINDWIKLKETLSYIAQQNIYTFRYTKWGRMPACVKRYVAWTERQLQGKVTREVPESKLQDLGRRRPSQKMFTDVALNFTSVVRGEP
jgi:hypothetical protein